MAFSLPTSFNYPHPKLELLFPINHESRGGKSNALYFFPLNLDWVSYLDKTC